MPHPTKRKEKPNSVDRTAGLPPDHSLGTTFDFAEQTGVVGAVDVDELLARLAADGDVPPPRLKHCLVRAATKSKYHRLDRRRPGRKPCWDHEVRNRDVVIASDG